MVYLIHLLHELTYIELFVLMVILWLSYSVDFQIQRIFFNFDEGFYNIFQTRRLKLLRFPALSNAFTVNR